jgi:hypothetical protein
MQSLTASSLSPGRLTLSRLGMPSLCLSFIMEKPPRRLLLRVPSGKPAEANGALIGRLLFCAIPTPTSRLLCPDAAIDLRGRMPLRGGPGANGSSLLDLSVDT